MKRSRLKRRTRLKSHKRLRRTRLERSGKRIRAVRPDRAKKRRERDFGAKRDWIVKLCCVVCGHHPVDPHHEPPRSRGGTKENLVPLCPGHHTLKDSSRHRLGSAERFREVYGVDLEAEAERLEREWRRRNG